MRVPIRTGRERVGLMMTPLIDVVFLLIIFFLVSSHLARQEVQLELELPTADSGREPREDNRPRVTINVLPEGKILLGSVEVDGPQLARRLKVETDRGGQDLEVRIRSARRVPYRLIEPILVACSKAGAWNVTFAVTPRD